MKYLSLTLPGGQTIEPPSSLGPKGGIETMAKVFSNAFIIMIVICIVLALIFVLLGGIQWIQSGGDKNKVQAARQKLTWAIGGLIVALVSFFIVSIIGYVFGVNLLDFPTS